MGPNLIRFVISIAYIRVTSARPSVYRANWSIPLVGYVAAIAIFFAMTCAGVECDAHIWIDPTNAVATAIMQVTVGYLEGIAALKTHVRICRVAPNPTFPIRVATVVVLSKPSVRVIRLNPCVPMRCLTCPGLTRPARFCFGLTASIIPAVTRIPFVF